VIVDRYLLQKKVTIHDNERPDFEAQLMGEIWVFV
jgi:hypothetical protein